MTTLFSSHRVSRCVGLKVSQLFQKPYKVLIEGREENKSLFFMVAADSEGSSVISLSLPSFTLMACDGVACCFAKSCLYRQTRWCWPVALEIPNIHFCGSKIEPPKKGMFSLLIHSSSCMSSSRLQESVLFYFWVFFGVVHRLPTS